MAATLSLTKIFRFLQIFVCFLLVRGDQGGVNCFWLAFSIGVSKVCVFSMSRRFGCLGFWVAVMEDIEESFGRRLVLTKRERVGVVIGASAVFDRFIGYPYSLVVVVVTTVYPERHFH